MPPLDHQGFVSSQDPRTVNPTVQPSPQGGGSLQGTMTTPQVSTQPQGLPTTGNAAFYNALSQFMTKANANNELVEQKNVMLKHLFDSGGISPEEKSKLPASVQMDLEKGNDDLIKLNVELINEKLSGRVNQTLNSVQYLLKGYQEDQRLAEERRQQSQAQIQNAITQFGSRAFSNLSPEGKRQLEQAAGLGTGYLDKIPKTISERNLELDAYKASLDGSDSVDPFGNVYLPEKDIKAIDSSAEGKKLKALGELKRSTKTYQDLVNQHGVEIYGANRSALESAYADLKVKWKEAANLGALTGPDLELIVDAVKPATGIGGIKAKLVGGLGGIKKSLDQLLTTTDTEADVAKDLIASKKSSYGNSSYLQELYSPFKDVEGGGTTLMVGPDGKQWNVPNDKIDIFKQNGFK